MAYKYPDCATCAFHDREPAICEGCDDGSEYEADEELPDDWEDLAQFDVLEELAA